MNVAEYKKQLYRMNKAVTEIDDLQVHDFSSELKRKHKELLRQAKQERDLFILERSQIELPM